MKTFALILTLALSFAAAGVRAQNEPTLIPDVVDPAKLIPILPEPPAGWTAEKAEGSSDDVGGLKITNELSDYQQGSGADAPTSSISILDSVATPDYVEATTNGWKKNSETPSVCAKSARDDGNPGVITYDKEP